MPVRIAGRNGTALTHSNEVTLDRAESASAEIAQARNWTRILNRYREPNATRSVVELAISFLPLAVLWFAMWAAVHFVGFWLALLIAVPAAGFLVRLFMIQHDCGHGAFFPHKLVE